MPLIIPKENSTQEEINAWIVETQEKYNQMENDLEKKTTREAELIDYNNKLFAKVTTKKEEKEEEKENEEENEIKEHIGKELYGTLNKKEMQLLNEIMKGEDD